MSHARRAVSAVSAALALAAPALRRRHRMVTRSIPRELRSPVLYLPMSVGGKRMLRVGRFLLPRIAPPATTPVREVCAPRDPGVGEVRLLVYESPDRVRPSGALLWIHGGGLVMGAAEGENRFASDVATELGALVVSVDYRLAPEHPFPAALDDCYAALDWIHQRAADLGVDPRRVAVGGASAGGGLAASLTQLALDRNGPPICFQLLRYPMLDDRTTRRRDDAATSALVWTAASNRFGWSSYLGTPAGGADAAPPAYASAARRVDLAGLPATWIGVGDADLFRDEDVAYAERLEAAGVDVDLHVVPGMYHGADDQRPKVASMADFRTRQLDALRGAIGPAAEHPDAPEGGRS